MDVPQANLEEVEKIKAVLARIQVSKDEMSDDEISDDEMSALALGGGTLATASEGTLANASGGALANASGGALINASGGALVGVDHGKFDNEIQSLLLSLSDFAQPEVQQVRMLEHVVFGKREKEREREREREREMETIFLRDINVNFIFTVLRDKGSYGVVMGVHT